MRSYIKPVTNHAALRGEEKWACAMCGSANVKYKKTNTTPMGIIRRHMECKSCGNRYDISHKNYLEYVKTNGYLE